MDCPGTANAGTSGRDDWIVETQTTASPIGALRLSVNIAWSCNATSSQLLHLEFEHKAIMIPSGVEMCSLHDQYHLDQQARSKQLLNTVPRPRSFVR